MMPKEIVAIKDGNLYKAIYCLSIPEEGDEDIGSILKQYYNSLESVQTLIAAGNIIGIDSTGYFSYQPKGDNSNPYKGRSYQSLSEIFEDAKLNFMEQVNIYIDNAWETIKV